MAHGDFQDLPKRTISDKVLRDKHIILLKILNIMDINASVLQWFKFSGGAVKSKIMSKHHLAEELYKRNIKKIEKCNLGCWSSRICI